MSEFLEKINLRQLLFLLIPIIFTVWSSTAPATDLRIVVLMAIWITGLMLSFPLLSLPIRLLRKIPALLWIIWLIALITVLVIWLLRFQPAVGLPLSITEQLWLAGTVITLIFLPFAGISSDESIRIGWLAGPLITLTTLVFIVIGIELGMRYVWVMSDNFQFSKMHSNWNRLYWNPINEAGYRDYPVPLENDGQIHILVMGDSLVTGYGVDNIADTFPHILDDALDDDYSVNIVAQPGWGVFSAFGAVQAYPIEPDILILSHYINDINEGTAAQEYGQAFPQIRIDPTESQRWWTERFYIANFLYYRVFLYTQHDSVGLYNDWVYGAYDNQAVWTAYQEELQTVIDWTAENDIPLIVLVWSNLLDIEGSESITEPVVTYFSEQNIPVVDMSDYLIDLPVSQRTVNPFDAHPGERSHRIAGEELAEVLSEE